jgi:ABC-type uncharacterized transport system involved in gliding motility auxiliary subunit
MIAKWLKAKQTKYAAYVTVYVLVVLGVIGAVNFLAQRHNRSLDTTSNKRFSLADQSVKVVRELKEDVKITYFDRTSNFQNARDLLDRYDNLSPKLSVEYIDPDRKPTVARAAGVRSYGTIFVEAAGRKEEAKSVTEEEITGALIRALKGGVRTVCFVTGAGEHRLDDFEREGYSNFKELIERNNYKTQTISLIEKPEVPSECTVVVVGGPKYDYLEPAVKALKSWVENGGAALFMLDPPLRLGSGGETSDNAALVQALESWGVVLNKDLVLDTSGIGQLFGLNEAVPLVASYEFHPIVREMREIATAFPLVRSVDTKSAEKTSLDKLFSSSSNSYATTNLSSSSVKIDPDKDKKGPLTLAVAGTYDTGKENKKGRFVVVGSSSWVANSILRFNGNRDLAMNMLNWLSADEDLISIRPKEQEDRRLSLTSRQMRLLFYASVVGFPLIILAAGLSVWWRRR